VVVLATGGYGNVFFLATYAKGCNATAIWRAHKKGAGFANPCFTQIHPTCIPASGEYQSKLTLMSESLRNDGRIWVPLKAADKRAPNEIPEGERDYFLERMYPSFGNLAPRDVASRAVKRVLRRRTGHRSGRARRLPRLRGRDPSARSNRHCGEVRQPLRDVRAHHRRESLRGADAHLPRDHYTMGGLWVDYNLMSTIPGLFVTGEANFSDHGANRLGASALMQGLADGYFILPYTIGNFLAGAKARDLDPSHAAFTAAEASVRSNIDRLLSIRGTRTVLSLHRELGKIMWEHCGMTRNAAGLTEAIEQVRTLRAEFWQDVAIPGTGAELNQSLEAAGRVADFLELAELMCRDALAREESCGAHFREEYQTPDGEALRNDERFCHAAVLGWMGADTPPVRHEEPLVFDNVALATRSYK
jgi:succinate dehydrogenase / fumarate reductase flavoprotein subunit